MSRGVKYVVLLVFCVQYISAQTSTSSPYSRFGLGELNNNSFPVYSSLGGASSAYAESNIINFNNPATYSFINSNTFLLSTGGWHQTTRISNKSNSQVANNNGFNHLTMAFPISKRFGASVGLLPYTSIGYEMNNLVSDEDNASQTADASYFGDGGISKIYFGGAYKFSENFSLGVNASFLFGSLNRRKELVYNDLSFLNSRSNSRLTLKGYYYEFGFLFKEKFEENKILKLGFVFNNNSTLRAKKSELIESFQFSGINQVAKDTVVNSISWGDITLPKYISAGISFKKQEKWLFAVDYSAQNWQDYSFFGTSDNLVNSTKICGGFQFTPDYNSISNYFKRIDYRIGASYSTLPLQFESDKIDEINISFGFGLPMRKSGTKYDLAFVLGQRGSKDNNLIKEEFIRVALSISYNGIWFVKRKYD